jgi:hypothetical protein
MGRKKEQTKDIRFYLKFLRVGRKHRWIFKTPIRHLEKIFISCHQTLGESIYFDTVMAEIGLTPKCPLSYYRNELASDEILKNSFLRASEANINPNFHKIWTKRLNSEGYVANYYALIREVKPKIVIETGTSEGKLTSWILSAMHKNNCGKLISIDIPPQEGKLTMSISLLPKDIGRFIPNVYRDRWEYHCGDAKEFLPKLLIANDVDIFIHDSLHTRTHMLFEYNCARALMRPNTIIMSDDILWNKAFFSFLSSHNLRGFSSVTSIGLGLTVNKFEPYEEDIGLGVVRAARFE